MPRFSNNNPVFTSARGARLAYALFSAMIVVVLLVGCNSASGPNTVKADGPVGAKTVQAKVKVDAAAPIVELPSWLPANAEKFARGYKGPIWFPEDPPTGFRVASLDVVEMDPGTGLVCDSTLMKGDDIITYTQGSAKARSYDIVSVGKVAWGSQQADVVHADAADPSSPKMIVMRQAGSLAELSGSVPFETLVEMAKGMKELK